MLISNCDRLERFHRCLIRVVAFLQRRLLLPTQIFRAGPRTESSLVLRPSSDQISSVRCGIKGCSNRIVAESTKSITARADLFLRFVFAENVSLGRFNKPIAVIAPDKIIEMLGNHVEVIFAIRRLDCVDCLIQPSEHFDGVKIDRVAQASGLLASGTLALPCI